MASINPLKSVPVKKNNLITKNGVNEDLVLSFENEEQFFKIRGISRLIWQKIDGEYLGQDIALGLIRDGIVTERHRDQLMKDTELFLIQLSDLGLIEFRVR